MGPTKRRVLSLIRVSGKPQIDRTGIPRQIETIKNLCEQHKLIVEEGDEYRFEGLSGASVDRFPQFLAMLDRLKDPAIHGMVFSEVSRFFRPSSLDQFVLTKEFHKNRKLIFCQSGVLDLQNERDMKAFNQEALEAGSYRRRLLENTKWGRDERRRQGDCKSDPLPKGIIFVPHPKIKEELVVGHFEYTDEAVRMIDAYRRILAGDSYSQVARDLGFYSPTELRNYLRSRWWIQEKASYKIRINTGLREDGREYSGYRQKRDVPVIVAAKFNCKACPVRGVDVYQEPLVPRLLFDSVQEILDRTERTWTKQSTANNKSIALGKGILRCARCLKKLYTKPNKKTGKVYYRCSSYNNGNRPCGAPHVDQSKMDKELTLFAFVKLTDRQYLKSLVSVAPRRSSINILKQKENLEKRLDVLYSKLGSPTLDQGKIEGQINNVTEELKRLSEIVVMATAPVVSEIDIESMRKTFLGFAHMSVDDQQQWIMKTFQEVIVDYDEEDKSPIIMRVKLRPQV